MDHRSWCSKKCTLSILQCWPHIGLVLSWKYIQNSISVMISQRGTILCCSSYRFALLMCICSHPQSLGAWNTLTHLALVIEANQATLTWHSGRLSAICHSHCALHHTSLQRRGHLFPSITRSGNHVAHTLIHSPNSSPHRCARSVVTTAVHNSPSKTTIQLYMHLYDTVRVLFLPSSPNILLF